MDTYNRSGRLRSEQKKKNEQLRSDAEKRAARLELKQQKKWKSNVDKSYGQPTVSEKAHWKQLMGQMLATRKKVTLKRVRYLRKKRWHMPRITGVKNIPAHWLP